MEPKDLAPEELDKIQQVVSDAVGNRPFIMVFCDTLENRVNKATNVEGMHVMADKIPRESAVEILKVVIHSLNQGK